MFVPIDKCRSLLRRPDAPGAIVVWTATALMTFGLGAFIAAMRFPFPYGDDYLFQEVLSGDKPLTWEWLWTPVFAHRATFVRLWMYLWAQATHLDLKLAAFVNVALYGFVAVCVVRAFRRARGGYALTDVVLPLAILSSIHLANIMAFLQLQFIIPYAMMLVLFSMVWTCRENPWNRRVVAMCVATIFIPPHCSAFGYAVAFWAFVWLGWLALAYAPVKGGRLWLCLGVYTLVCIAHFAWSGTWGVLDHYVNKVSVSMCAERFGHELTPMWRVFNGLQFLSLWGGVTLARQIPLWIAAVQLPALGVLGYALLRRWQTCPEDRAKLSAAFFLIASILSTAILIGLGKHGGWFFRYYTLVAPLIVGTYAGLELLREHRAARTGQIALAVCMLGTMAWSYTDGGDHNRERRFSEDSFMSWVKTGADRAIVDSVRFPGMRYLLVYPDADTYYGNVERLRRTKMALFRHFTLLFPFRNKTDLAAWTVSARRFYVMRGGPRDSGVMAVRPDGQGVTESGEALSAPFGIENRYLCFDARLRRGEAAADVNVQLVEDGSNVVLVEHKVVFGREAPEKNTVDLGAKQGKTARIRILVPSATPLINFGPFYLTEDPEY
jgi:hypothetical protein